MVFAEYLANAGVPAGLGGQVARDERILRQWPPDGDVWYPPKVRVIGCQVPDLQRLHDAQQDGIVGHQSMLLADRTGSVQLFAGHWLNANAETVIDVARNVQAPL